MINAYRNLEYFEAKSPVELKQFVARLPREVEVVSIYGMNGRHFVWFRYNGKIKKVKPDGVTE
jgi:hypothetical protein